MGRAALHQRAHLDEAISRSRCSGTFGSGKIRAAPKIRRRRYHRSDQGSRSAPEGSWPEVHDMVTAETSGIPATTIGPGEHHPVHNTPAPSARGLWLPRWTDMVRESGSGLRGKKNRKALSPSASRRNRGMRRRTGAAGNDTSRRAELGQEATAPLRPLSQVPDDSDARRLRSPYRRRYGTAPPMQDRRSGPRLFANKQRRNRLDANKCRESH